MSKILSFVNLAVKIYKQNPLEKSLWAEKLHKKNRTQKVRGKEKSRNKI